jgi:hypothetical protein
LTGSCSPLTVRHPSRPGGPRLLPLTQPQRARQTRERSQWHHHLPDREEGESASACPGPPPQSHKSEPHLAILDREPGSAAERAHAAERALRNVTACLDGWEHGRADGRASITADQLDRHDALAGGDGQVAGRMRRMTSGTRSATGRTASATKSGCSSGRYPRVVVVARRHAKARRWAYRRRCSRRARWVVASEQTHSTDRNRCPAWTVMSRQSWRVVGGATHSRTADWPSSSCRASSTV